jgi:hypothetical protein
VIRYRAGALLAAAAVAAGTVGCGGSSKSSSSASSSTAAASTASTTTAASSSSGSGPLSKAAYEQQLGPLLNNQVAPALRTALANGGIADPKKLSSAIAEIKLAHDRMAAVNPPGPIAALHQQAVAALAAIKADMEKLRSAELKKAKPDALSALNSLKTDAQKIVTVGNQFQARGF